MPGSTSRAFDTLILTSTRYVDRAMASPVKQNPDLSLLISEIAEKLGQFIIRLLSYDLTEVHIVVILNNQPR